jgi:hypothetical protein
VSVGTLAAGAAVADAAMNGTVIYVVVNITAGGVPGSATSDNPVVYWDTDADGDPDEAIALIETPQILIGADDVV